MLFRFPRRFVITVLAALVLGAELLLRILLQPEGGSWAAVYSDARLNVRDAAGILKARGLTLVSEAELWVLLDDFSEIKQIPLDQYDDFVEPFDPRNDGYAAELRSFFAREGERRFFVMAAGTPPAALERLLDEAVRAGGGTLRRVEHSGGRALYAPDIVLFAAAFALSAVLLGRKALFSLCCVFPVAAFLSFFGPAGIAAAGFLLAVYCLAEPPLEERFRSPHSVSRILYRSLADEFRAWFRTFPFELAGAIAGIILYWLSCVLGKIPPDVSIPAFCFFTPLLLLPRWAEAGRVNERFFPFSIRKDRALLVFPPVLPVFTAAFALALGLFVARGAYGTDVDQREPPRSGQEQNEQALFGGGREGDSAWPPLPGPERYSRHEAFQRGFSRRSLRNTAPAGVEAGYVESVYEAAGEVYGTYSLAPDGLLGGFTELPPLKTVPPYPEIPAELGKEPKGGVGNPGQNQLSLRAGCIILALMFCVSVASAAGIVRYRKKRRDML